MAHDCESRFYEYKIVLNNIPPCEQVTADCAPCLCLTAGAGLMKKSLDRKLVINSAWRVAQKTVCYSFRYGDALQDVKDFVLEDKKNIPLLEVCCTLCNFQGAPFKIVRLYAQ